MYKQDKINQTFENPYKESLEMLFNMTQKNIEGLLAHLGIELDEADQKSYDDIKLVPNKEERDKNIKDLINTFDDTEWEVLAKKNKFLRKVTALITADSDMAYKLAVSAGIFLISLTTRKTQYIDLAQAKIRFNIFMLVMGFSGKSRKTTTFSMIEKIINIMDSDMLLPDSMTPQAMFKELIQQPDAVFMRDELSGFFQSLEQKYMKGTIEFMSKLYDVKDIIKEGTISRGKQVLEHSYFRFYGGTTPTVVKYLKDEYFEQGFLARFHFIYDNDKIRPRKMLGWNSSMFDKNLQSVIDDLQRMKDCPVDAFLARDKPQIFADYEEYCYEEADKYLMNDDFLLAAFYERLPIHSLKLAGLFQLSDIAEVGYTLNEIVLHPNHVELACKFGRLFEQEYLNLVYRYRSEAPSAPFKTEERRLNKVLNIIKQSGDWMKYSELHRKTKMVDRIFKETLTSLNSMEQIGEVMLTKEKLIDYGLMRTGDKLPITGRLPILIFLSEQTNAKTIIAEFCLKNKIVDGENYKNKHALKGFIEKYKIEIIKPSVVRELEDVLTDMIEAEHRNS